MFGVMGDTAAYQFAVNMSGDGTRQLSGEHVFGGRGGSDRDRDGDGMVQSGDAWHGLHGSWVGDTPYCPVFEGMVK